MITNHFTISDGVPIVTRRRNPKSDDLPDSILFIFIFFQYSLHFYTYMGFRASILTRSGLLLLRIFQ